MELALIIVAVVMALIIGLALFASSPREMDVEAQHEAYTKTPEELRHDTEVPEHHMTRHELDVKNEHDVDAQR